jgi:hypothetical protein
VPTPKAVGYFPPGQWAARHSFSFAEKKMNTDMKSGMEFVGALAQFLKESASTGIALYEIRYDDLAFGSFVVVVGHRKRRIKVIWDGRDSFLDILGAEFSDSSSRPEWTGIENLTIEPPAYDVIFSKISDAVRQIAANQ